MKDNKGSFHFVRPSKSLKVIAFFALIILASPTKQSNAQDIANGTATATVQASLIVTAANALQFGLVFQGVAKSMANNIDATSGIFNIVGEGTAGISLYFGLPDYVALADGSDRMTIAFSNIDATVDTNNTTPATVVGGDGWVNTNPRAIPAAAVIGTGGQTNVYLGGRVTPTIDQKSGAYAGDIVLSVAYNGT